MNIRKLCEQKRISMKQLSEKSEVSLAYLYEIDKGLKTPTVTVAKRIAKVLKVSMNKLTEDIA